MLILDKTRALDRIVARSRPQPDSELLPDLFRMLHAGPAPASFGLAFDPYLGLSDRVAEAELASVAGPYGSRSA
jgi:hypothetical protein